jgi:hypothetical protein
LVALSVAFQPILSELFLFPLDEQEGEQPLPYQPSKEMVKTQNKTKAWK